MRSLMCVMGILGAARVADASPCSVNIARAPDGVRDVVAKWVLAEHDCGPALEVRIVETPDGLYVLARDEAGRTHERVVPDAQTAGVLVASWAAASGGESSAVRAEMSIELSWAAPATSAVIAPGTTTVLAPGAARVSARDSMPVPAPPPGPAPIVMPVRVVAPSDTLLVDAAVVPAARTKVPAKWMSLGGTLGAGGAGAYGVRGEADLAARGAWRFGVTGSIAHVDVNPDLGRYAGYLDLLDMQAAVYATHSVDVGNWQVRAGAGVGLVLTRGNGTLFDRADVNEKAALWPQISDLSAIGEVAVSFSHGLGWQWPGWGFQLGPVVTVHDQSMKLKMGEANLPYDSDYVRSGVELMFYGGIRHEL
ncbi:MAG TPA: hypothetical protein VMZ53_00155 [Kofleriaceae bacterium]|nr:hypothetical protein [Kofleriaceae bacterium]